MAWNVALNGFFDGRYWIRTSDPFRVKEFFGHFGVSGQDCFFAKIHLVEMVYEELTA
ncbi:Hypothetical protein SynRCC307_0690 [Synechococcus sp. RCC307]|nr:Hypothetical protein SynRCC307_0690 [Synechococcus sp. RCC307]